MHRSILGLLFILLISAGSDCVNSAGAQDLPNGFLFESLVNLGLSSPTDFCQLPDGRVLFSERNTGNIKLWVPANGDQVTSIGAVAGIQASGERGLLSLCVDPDFTSNGYLYLWLTRVGNPGVELLRYECAGDLDDSSSADLVMVSATERIILHSVPDAAPLHNGGCLRFGPDGKLFISIGDDNNRDSAQDTSSLAGCLLRLDVSGVPPGAGTVDLSDLDPGDNTFFDSGLVEERLVVAWGLRNPFSYAIDKLTGDLFIADVGASQEDELNLLPRAMDGTWPALNFGWPWREGAGSGPGLTTMSSAPVLATFAEPIDTRTHVQEGFAIMAGGVYRNLGSAEDWGPAYERSVFHCDFILGTLERRIFNGLTQTWDRAAPVPGQSDPDYWGTGFVGFVRFGLGDDGALYALDHLAGRFGRIRQVAPSQQLTVVGGEGQVGMRHFEFAETFDLQLTDSMGAPIAGAMVTSSVSPNASILGPSSAVTDSNGCVSFRVRPDEGGVITLNANVPQNTLSVQAFARGLHINFVPGATNDILVAEFVNTSLGTDPIPILFYLVPPSEPITTTIYGDLAFDLLNPGGTVIIEDPTGIFDGIQLEGGWGTPGRTNVYILPVGLLSGTLRFQCIWADGTTLSSIIGIPPSPIALSNILTVNF